METTFRLIIFLFGIIGITAFSCKKESSVSNNNHLGEPFLIKVNEDKSLTPILSDKNIIYSCLSVSFKKVIFDSRCAKPSCYLCYGSTASVQVFFSHQKDTASISLTILGCDTTNDEFCYQPVDTLGYRICLLRLDPYPDGFTPINPLNYTAKLKISKL
jgi:hypothetical protein